MRYDSIAVLIPAYKPDYRLDKLVHDLYQKGFRKIIVVDDGSGKDYAPIFKKLSGKATVLSHLTNCGKGAALKTGISEIINMKNISVVTADSDGQHSPNDIVRIAEAMLDNPEILILGKRDKKKMPMRSKFGNTLTCGIFRLLTGVRLSDTQTGLRGLPYSTLNAFSQLDGNRYEYEINMLIKAGEMRLPIKEISIETIYLDKNSSSHFHKLKDSFNIYAVMFRQAGRFCLSSLLSMILDYLIFILCLYVAKYEVLICQIVARIVSSMFNYLANSQLVFKKKPDGRSLLRYYLLVIIVLGFSCLGIRLLMLFHIPKLLTKIIVDVVLFFFGYRVQRSKVFDE